MRPVPVRIVLVVAFVAGLALVGCASGPQDPSSVTPTAILASGIEGGTYHERYARTLTDRLSGWNIDTKVTEGSTANLDMLVNGTADLGLTQTDVYASRVSEEPDVFAPLIVVAPVAEECVFIAYRIDGEVDEFSELAQDVGDREAIISVGTADGGMAETWNYLSSLLPEQSNADIDNRAGQAGLEALAAGEIDAVAWMTAPSNADHVLRAAVRGNKALGFLNIVDERLVNVLERGVEVYHSKSVPIPGVPGEKIDTLCTNALLVVRPDAPAGLVEALNAVGIGS